jgi:uncharacterized protein YndB with AHSA1/START domain
MSDVLTIRAELAAPPAAVRRALTDPAALRIWLAEHAEAEPFGFWGRHTPQGDRGRQRLLALDPLSFEWTLDGEPTVVTVTVTVEPAAGDRSTLSLRHDNLPTLEELMAPTGRRDGRHTMHTFWPLAIANLAEYVEGRPLTPKADFGPTRPAEIRVSFTVDAAPAEVFRSLTDAAQATRWFGWEVEIEPWVGGTMTVGVEGKIFEFEPDKKLSYGDDEGAVVRWELAGSAGKTFLTFVQSGYTDDELDNVAQHEAGWLGSFAELKRMHELGPAWTPLTTDLPEGG